MKVFFFISNFHVLKQLKSGITKQNKTKGKKKNKKKKQNSIYKFHLPQIR